MRCWVGIDLGSTTTKAVVLDEHGSILGRGITNSRNNYDAACAIAQSEAFIDARFTLVRRSLDGGRGDPGRSAPAAPKGLVAIRPAREPFVDTLARAFRLEQHVCQMGQLREESVAEATKWESRSGTGGLGKAIAGIFTRMEEEAPSLFAPGVRERSDFFRDIAGSRYMSLAEQSAVDTGIAFETLAGIFDKSILKVENRLLDLSFETHIQPAARRALDGASGLDPEEGERIRRVIAEEASSPLETGSSVGTGYGRARLPFPRERIRSEILCHGLGANTLFPGTATVLDIGGQDTKAIQVDSDGIVTSFQMNDRCAAGCGRYLGYIADEMNLGLHELGPLAQSARNTVKISSTCTVFAGAEIRDRLSMGQKREEILAGLHRAIILRAMSLLARSGGVHDEFTFTGGVARNPAAVEALEKLVHENYGERTINISADSIFTGALGAALFALRSGGEDAGPGPSSGEST
jgi:benzoyl-CoA reductase subunit A